MRKNKYRNIKAGNKCSVVKFTLTGKSRKLVLLLLLLCIICSVCYELYLLGKRRYENYVKFFNEFQPAFAPGDNANQYVDLDLNRPFNLLVVGLDSGKSGHVKADAVMLVHFDSSDRVFQFMSLPCKAFYFVPELEDYFQLDNIYAFGQLETPERGMDLMRTILEDNLALSIDGYFAVDIEWLEKTLDILGNITVQNEQKFTDNDLAVKGLRDSFMEGKLKLSSDDAIGYLMADEGGFSAQSQRHYAVLNALKLAVGRSLIFKLHDQLEGHQGFFSNLSGSSIKEIMNFAIENKERITFHLPGLLTDDKVIKDKSVPVFSSIRFDQKISEIFINQDIKLEQARIEVYNGTSSIGLAGRYSRYIINFGGDVTRISSKSEEFDQTLIFVNDLEKYKNTLGNLRVIFQNSQLIEGLPDFSVTGDIIIIIGKDYEM